MGNLWLKPTLKSFVFKKGVAVVREAVDTHRNARFVHNFPTGKNAFGQDFPSLSTDIHGGYYYYLYIQETRPQANPTAFKSLKTQLTKNLPAVQDFQLKKKRVTA
jgi:hypothetical protein